MASNNLRQEGTRLRPFDFQLTGDAAKYTAMVGQLLGEGFSDLGKGIGNLLGTAAERRDKACKDCRTQTEKDRELLEKKADRARDDTLKNAEFLGKLVDSERDQVSQYETAFEIANQIGGQVDPSVQKEYEIVKDNLGKHSAELERQLGHLFRGYTPNQLGESPDTISPTERVGGIKDNPDKIAGMPAGPGGAIYERRVTEEDMANVDDPMFQGQKQSGDLWWVKTPDGFRYPAPGPIPEMPAPPPPPKSGGMTEEASKAQEGSPFKFSLEDMGSAPMSPVAKNTTPEVYKSPLEMDLEIITRNIKDTDLLLGQVTKRLGQGKGKVGGAQTELLNVAARLADKRARLLADSKVVESKVTEERNLRKTRTEDEAALNDLIAYAQQEAADRGIDDPKFMESLTKRMQSYPNPRTGFSTFKADIANIMDRKFPSTSKSAIEASGKATAERKAATDKDTRRKSDVVNATHARMRSMGINPEDHGEDVIRLQRLIWDMPEDSTLSDYEKRIDEYFGSAAKNNPTLAPLAPKATGPESGEDMAKRKMAEDAALDAKGFSGSLKTVEEEEDEDTFKATETRLQRELAAAKSAESDAEFELGSARKSFATGQIPDLEKKAKEARKKSQDAYENLANHQDRRVVPESAMSLIQTKVTAAYPMEIDPRTPEGIAIIQNLLKQSGLRDKGKVLEAAQEDIYTASLDGKELEKWKSLSYEKKKEQVKTGIWKQPPAGHLPEREKGKSYVGSPNIPTLAVYLSGFNSEQSDMYNRFTPAQRESFINALRAKGRIR